METPSLGKLHAEMCITFKWEHGDKGKHFGLSSSPKICKALTDPLIYVLCMAAAKENKGILQPYADCNSKLSRIASDMVIETPSLVLATD